MQSATDSLSPSGAYSLPEEEYEYKRYDTEIIIAYFLILFGAIPASIMGIYLLTRNNERAKFHGKLILLISLVFFFIVFGVSGLLIYNSYFHSPTAINSATDISSVRPPITNPSR